MPIGFDFALEGLFGPQVVVYSSLARRLIGWKPDYTVADLPATLDGSVLFPSPQGQPIKGGRVGVSLVAVSPATTYRVLKAAGRLDRKSPNSSSQGSGFKQPEKPHQHWNVDVRERTTKQSVRFRLM